MEIGKFIAFQNMSPSLGNPQISFRTFDTLLEMGIVISEYRIIETNAKTPLIFNSLLSSLKRFFTDINTIQGQQSQDRSHPKPPCAENSIRLVSLFNARITTIVGKLYARSNGFSRLINIFVALFIDVLLRLSELLPYLSLN
ncbi:MAG: hypothetical protein MN733_14285 [Nitrososphaera sp.]|nr:hypothetical protein [Nitrososphaera sp.]